ncbi:hypothetical protein [Rhizobium halophytocola]|uniref:hypothetical protein n=1 Tax=Rhizobium halophytocola TaxID=735519 RepID=UPI001AE9A853|nr:hypothetical protein [Rhizobium halophytocola]
MLKVLLSSLLAGLVLSLVGVNLETALSFIGQTPETLAADSRRLFEWAAPKTLLGAIFVIPGWLIIYLFLPYDDD